MQKYNLKMRFEIKNVRDSEKGKINKIFRFLKCSSRNNLIR